MFLIALIFILTIAILIYDRSLRSSRVWKLLTEQFPGEPPLPLIGNVLQLGTSPDATQKNLNRLWEKHGMKNFRVALGTNLVLMLSEAEDVKILLSSTTEIKKSDHHMKIFVDYFGQSLVNATGERWRTMRKIISSSFNTKLLEQYLVKINAESKILCQALNNYVDQPAEDVYKDIENCASEIILSAVMGLENVHSDPDKIKYVEASNRILPICIKRMYSVFHQIKFLYKISSLGKMSNEVMNDVNEAVDSIISRRKKYFEENIMPSWNKNDSLEDFVSKNRRNLSLIDVMLLSHMPDGSPVPDHVMREEIHLMIFAGFETTVVTAAFSLSNLAKYKDIQEKAYQEQVMLFGNDFEKDPTLEDINKMDYLTRVIKETLRMYPAGTNFSRHINADMTLHDGKILPAGSNIIFNVPGLHYNPKYFKEPEKFNPDRFIEPIVPGSFIPFSGGIKNCVGMNFAWVTLRSMLSSIIRRYEVSLEKPEDEPNVVYVITPSSANGHRIKFTKRNNIN